MGEFEGGSESVVTSATTMNGEPTSTPSEQTDTTTPSSATQLPTTTMEPPSNPRTSLPVMQLPKGQELERLFQDATMILPTTPAPGPSGVEAGGERVASSDSATDIDTTSMLSSTTAKPSFSSGTELPPPPGPPSPPSAPIMADTMTTTPGAPLVKTKTLLVTIITCLLNLYTILFITTMSVEGVAQNLANSNTVQVNITNNATLLSNATLTISKPGSMLVPDHVTTMIRISAFVKTGLPRKEGETLHECHRRASGISQEIFRDVLDTRISVYSLALHEWADKVCDKQFVPAVRPKSTWEVVKAELQHHMMKMKSMVGDIARTVRESLVKTKRSMASKVKGVALLGEIFYVDGTGDANIMTMDVTMEPGAPMKDSTTKSTPAAVVKHSQTIDSSPSTTTNFSTGSDPATNPTLGSSTWTTRKDFKPPDPAQRLDEILTILHALLFILNTTLFTLFLLRQGLSLVLITVHLHAFITTRSISTLFQPIVFPNPNPRSYAVMRIEKRTFLGVYLENVLFDSICFSVRDGWGLGWGLILEWGGVGCYVGILMLCALMGTLWVKGGGWRVLGEAVRELYSMVHEKVYQMVFGEGQVEEEETVSSEHGGFESGSDELGTEDTGTVIIDAEGSSGSESSEWEFGEE
ncbi:hypothetical protein GQ43DRAFT_311790 [Delitschia confertaspora ATCC 74209]|uniref:Uncharacterized protein n=1 Tax=Delitschia confertaspora ATCC 74209 TaxID=1513339 RepID=A0A9P4MR04_9PLEO|nr:hypothetical protein GQ43DRAFT_311790 [Delitschia confertaspora ATCC 74209]